MQWSCILNLPFNNRHFLLGGEPLDESITLHKQPEKEEEEDDELDDHILSPGVDSSSIGKLHGEGGGDDDDLMAGIEDLDGQHFEVLDIAGDDIPPPHSTNNEEDTTNNGQNEDGT